MIYTTVGIKNNKMDELDGIQDEFEYILNRKPRIFKESAKEEFIKKNQVNFVAGLLTERDGNYYIRKDENLLHRTLIVLDFDDIPVDAETFKKAVHAGLAEFSYYLYPTKSHTPENPRYRLIVKPERNFIQAEHKPLIREIESRIGIKTGDNANGTWSQMNGFPTCIGGTEKAYREQCFLNRGNAYPITVEPEIAPKRSIAYDNSDVTPIPKELSHIMMEKYIMDAKNQTYLQDNKNYYDTLRVIVKSVQLGEISIEDGDLFAEMITCGNREWVDENIERFRKELEIPWTTENTFMNKFNYKNEMIKEVRNMGADAREYMKSNVIAMKPAKQTEKKLTTTDCAMLLMQKHDFKVIGEDDNAPLAMYLPDEGIYSIRRTPIERLIATVGDYNQREANDVIYKIKMRVTSSLTEKNPDLIPVANGIYNRKKHTLEPFSPEHVFTSKVTTKWVQNPEKPSWDVDEWLDTIANHDKDVVTLLWQIIAECLNGNYTRGEFFMIVGKKGNNGKGTFQELLRNLIGERNVSSLKLKQIGERFSPSLLVGKTLNIGDDISASTLPEVENLLSLLTDDSITIEEKGKQGYSFKSPMAFLFSANVIPKSTNKSNGLYRRMRIVPFLADFSNGVEDKSIKNEKIKRDDVLEYVLHKALALDFKEFIEPAITLQYKLEYMKDNDTIFEFYSDEWATSPMSEIDRIPTKYVYKQYEKFCIESGNKPDTMRTFTTSMMQFMDGTHEKKSSRITNEFRDYMITIHGKYATQVTEPYDGSVIQHFIKK